MWCQTRLLLIVRLHCMHAMCACMCACPNLMTLKEYSISNGKAQQTGAIGKLDSK